MTDSTARLVIHCTGLKETATQLERAAFEAGLAARRMGQALGGADLTPGQIAGELRRRDMLRAGGRGFMRYPRNPPRNLGPNPSNEFARVYARTLARAALSDALKTMMHDAGLTRPAPPSPVTPATTKGRLLFGVAIPC